MSFSKYFAWHRILSSIERQDEFKRTGSETRTGARCIVPLLEIADAAAPEEE